MADILPSSNRVDWLPGVTVGVRGGIPTRTTVFTNMAVGATAAQVASALAACPSNQVVMLAEGTNTWTSTVSITKDGVTLRGAGMGLTVIKSGAKFIDINGGSWEQYSTPTAISAGNTKGSSNVTVASSAGIAADDLVVIEQDNDAAFSWRRYNDGIKVVKHRYIVTGVNGNVVTVFPPLSITYALGNNPTMKRNTSRGCRSVGIEDITFQATEDGDEAGVGIQEQMWITYGVDCWVKNVEFNKVNNCFLFILGCIFTEVRGCYLHNDVASYNDGYGIETYETGGSCGILIENNVFYKLWYGVIMDSCQLSAVSYNLFTNTLVPTRQAPNDQQGMINHSHGLNHSSMILYEGNISEALEADNYHGSSSHPVIFRNSLHGLHAVNPAQNRNMVDLDVYCYYSSVVGNVLGNASTNGWVYNQTNNSYSPGIPVIFRMGYPNMGANSYVTVSDGPAPGTSPADYDTNVFGTSYIHGNYDYGTGAVTWRGDNADHTIPNSLLYGAKPSWWDTWGTTAWPPIGSDLTPMVSTIPAQRWYAGETGSGGGSARTRNMIKANVGQIVSP